MGRPETRKDRGEANPALSQDRSVEDLCGRMNVGIAVVSLRVTPQGVTAGDEKTQADWWHLRTDLEVARTRRLSEKLFSFRGMGRNRRGRHRPPGSAPVHPKPDPVHRCLSSDLGPTTAVSQNQSPAEDQHLSR